MTHVLIVDDKAENLYYLQALLTGHGFQVTAACHGAEALVKARQNPPDVIVSDLLMPVMDGYTLLRHWKADTRLKKVPFIVYTATYTEVEDEELALNLGADAFILKPAEPEAFLERLNEVKTNAAKTVPAPPRIPSEDVEDTMRVYSHTLIRKLEEKTLQLEEANRLLERDIAERKKVESSLRASEASMATAQKIAHFGSWELDLLDLDKMDDNRLRWSDEMFRIAGLAAETVEVSPKLFMKCTHPDDRGPVREAVLHAIHARHEYSITHRLVRPGGEERVVHQTAHIFYDENDGRPMKMVGTTHDITERCQAEKEIQRTSNLLHAVADGTPDALFIKDLQGRYLLFNKAAAGFVGRTVEEVIGQDDTALFSPEDAHKIMTHDRQVMEDGQACMTEEVLTAAGVTRAYLSTKAPYRDGKGTLLGLIGISRDVTEIKRTHEELHKMSARLSTTLEGMSDAFYLLDPATWTFVYLNAEAEKLLRRKREDLLGRVIWEEFPQALETELHEAYLRAVREQGKVTLEFYYPPLEHWFDLHAHASAEGLAVYFHVVTERKLAEAAVQESEKRYRMAASALSNVLDSSLDVICSFDATGCFVQVNKSCETVLGYTAEELLGTPYLEKVLPEDQPKTNEAAASIMSGMATSHFENRYMRKDGGIRYIQWSARWSEAEQIMFCVARDITEARQNAERIAEQAALLDKARDAIVVRDLDHHVLYWNRSAERLYGWTAQEAAGRSIQELAYRDPHAFLTATAETISQGEWTGELEQLRKDGSGLTIECRWTLVRDEQGRPKSILAINTDITERKKLEQQFLRAQRMESIGTLAGGIAHDLNNVLSPIMMAIDLLKLQEKDTRRLGILNTIETSTKRGADMVKQVLSFARGMEGQQLVVEPAPLLKEVEKIANETFLKNIEVRSTIPEDLWTVQGDPTQLHQVLINLCVNARDAMPNGGTLTLTAANVKLDEHYVAMNLDAKVGSYVSIQIEDTGMGMKPEVMERIFEPFFTTKELGKGTGLGLSTTLAIIKSHGGFVRVYSEARVGTRFHVYLPAHADVQNPQSHMAPQELPRGQGELVLVVDDEAAVRQITRQTLEAFGYQVILAADGAEATAHYATRKADISVVLTDMMMPVMDGPTMIPVLMRINPAVRIIAASGLNANGMVAKAANAGVKHFIPKPYTAETLLTILRKVLLEMPADS